MTGPIKVCKRVLPIIACLCGISLATFVALNRAMPRPGSNNASMTNSQKPKLDNPKVYAFANADHQGENGDITFELRSLRHHNGMLAGLFDFTTRTNVHLFGFFPPDNGRFAAHGARLFLGNQADWMEFPIWHEGLVSPFDLASNSPTILELDLSPLLKLPPSRRPVYVRVEEFKSTPFVFWQAEVKATD